MPYEVGRLRDGVGRGPEHLLAHGAEAALASGGATVSTELVELEAPEDNEVDTSFELMRRVAGRVADAVDEGAFPVILSGSCFAAVGVVGGLGERLSHVAWLDAHADFNSPETAIYGYLDGMGTAIITGSAWQGLYATVPGARPLPESSLVLAGARAFDPPEEERLRSSDVRQVEVADLVEALGEEGPRGLYLHVDLDVLDEKVNIYSAPGGPSAGELQATTGEILERFPVLAMSLTAYDPACDRENRIPPVATSLLRLLAERAAACG
jgi:arginase